MKKNMYERTGSTEHMMTVVDGKCIMYLEVVTDGDRQDAIAGVRSVIHEKSLCESW